VLVIHGDQDHVIPFEAGRALFDAVPEPKQFVTIRDGDHNDAAPADPQTYWTAVDAFMASLVVSHLGTGDWGLGTEPSPHVPESPRPRVMIPCANRVRR
jgi:hypothetical protein